MKLKEIRILIYMIGFIIIVSCSDNYDHSTKEANDICSFNDTTLVTIVEECEPSLIIHQGYVSNKDDTIRIVRNGICKAIVILSNPLLIAQADKEEIWGHFQFPGIVSVDHGTYLVTWSQYDDSILSYGNGTYGQLLTKDDGLTWESVDKDYFIKYSSGVDLLNGDYLQVFAPPVKDVKSYITFPDPVNSVSQNGYDFYFESELPEELRGAYFEIRDETDSRSSIIHSNIEDPGLLRYSINDMMPTVWHGIIRRLKDNSLLAGVYDPFYINSGGYILKSGITFYTSSDEGLNWKRKGIIPYQIKNDSIFDGNPGFSEPYFEVLDNGTILSVMRTGNNTPMYKSYSKDGGINWSQPQPFTPSGVAPTIVHLENGILALISGRPGLQLRFNINGDGILWTEPIEMLKFMDTDGKYSVYESTCGYPGVIKVNKDTFYMVYSDFKTKNNEGDYRKGIVFRKIKVVKNND